MNRKVFAVVPSAGMGKRFDPSKRKTFVEVDGLPLFICTLKRLHDDASVTEIIPILREEDIEMGREMISSHNIPGIRRIAPGGEERQDSIYNALKLIEEGPGADASDSLVLVHDGVRPYFPEDLIKTMIDEIAGYDGVIPGIAVKDTIKKIDTDGVVHSTLDREEMRAVQTPQCFRLSKIRESYDLAYKEGFYGTDDASLVERAGGRVKIIQGSPFNIKITTPEDLEMVKYMLKKGTGQSI